jgi:hypothetical protein
VTTIGLGGLGSFQLDPGGGNQFFDFAKPGGGTFSTIDSSYDGYYFLRSYTAGTIISTKNFGFNISNIFAGESDWDSILVAGFTAGAWTSSHNGYLGFRTAAGNFGYIEYDYTRLSSVSTITFLSGAYESVANVGITTPGTYVPEPTSTALFGLGLLGFAVSRRKSARKF